MKEPWLCPYNEEEFNQLKENKSLLMTAFSWDECTIYLDSKGIENIPNWNRIYRRGWHQDELDFFEKYLTDIKPVTIKPIEWI